MIDNLARAFEMGFLGLAIAFVGGWLLLKAIQGDITFSDAAYAWIPLFVWLLIIWASGFSFMLGLVGGVGYLGFLSYRNQREEKIAQDEMIAREIDKWTRAVVEDDRNSGAHLFLGNALVEQSDYDSAAEEYRKALELDPSNVRGLLSFLGLRPRDEVREIERRLPDLQLIAAEVKRRSSFEVSRVGLDADHPPTPLAANAEGEAPVPPAVLGFASEEERLEEARLRGRLPEMRKLLDDSPDDVATRLTYALLLAEAGYPERSREEYENVLARDPANPEATAALGVSEGAPKALPH